MSKEDINNLLGNPHNKIYEYGYEKDKRYVILRYTVT